MSRSLEAMIALSSSTDQSMIILQAMTTQTIYFLYIHMVLFVYIILEIQTDFVNKIKHVYRMLC